MQLLQGMNVPQPTKLENADSEIQQVISILNTKQERARTFSKRSFSLANEIKTLKKWFQPPQAQHFDLRAV